MKIALIGMPTSGKSLISELLVKETNYKLIDLDFLLESQFKMTLQNFIIQYGEEEFLKQESMLMTTIEYPNNSIISTGGSVVYAVDGMKNMKDNGIFFIYLDVPLENLEKRLVNQRDTRGIVMNGSKNWKDLFNSRIELYNKYADMIISTQGKTPQEICDEIKTIF